MSRFLSWCLISLFLLGTAHAQLSLWSNTTVPAEVSHADGAATELGVKFKSDIGGFIRSVRFYKGSANTGIHTVSLYASSGTLLARAVSANETASGWQQVDFATPVAVTANTVYVASYHTTSGYYSVTRPYFATQYDNSPLHALADELSGGNGVYRYGSTPGFPTNRASTNYWVDVVFTVTINPPITGLKVTLAWDASPTPGVIGYNVYRTEVNGVYGAALNSAPINSLGYVDVTVLAGHTYYYIAKSVGSDGQLSLMSDQVQITVSAIPPVVINQAPVVNAGVDGTILFPATISLVGVVTDDALPSGRTLSHSWSKLDGPGNVTFTALNSLSTTASFSIAGIYVLRLTSSDGALEGTNDVMVMVNAVPPQPPANLLIVLAANHAVQTAVSVKEV